MYKRFMGFVVKPDENSEICSHYMGYCDAKSHEDAFVHFFKRLQNDEECVLIDRLARLNPQDIVDLDNMRTSGVFLTEKEFIPNLDAPALIGQLPMKYDFNGMLTEGEPVVTLKVVSTEDIADCLNEIIGCSGSRG